ncbi:LCP family protein [Microbacterium sp. EYE_5]|uniref:LCP family protein n=1 Tax=unclassified Microbacterium TaxID=2609290 RepID=UPI002004490B|nr:MULTISPECIES: LCP family protein [unclassified Microbacterium]MCK6081528.1 LCP family protein [Microbacterium sp. EYE_382]MCK6086798.1 LCP family protein [Microbacterium sp. EYE_384]MCK6123704.1 LCP family protein [Microbacterium sp. EYE_80]MCK6126613.1 LCP family protein [Microbacterium sp. EYE_79]MCK6142482.1 LCP family protein [Microbacterium sp. EYE_39]
MSVSSPPRPPQAGARPRAVEERPLRNPDASSAAFMSRRAWWLVVAGFLFPGAGQILAGNRRLGRVGIVATIVMWTLLAAAVLTGLMWRSLLTTIVASWWTLTLMQVLLWAYAVLWVVLTVDVLRLVRLGRVPGRTRAAVVVVALILSLVPASAAAYSAQSVVAPLRSGLSIFAAGPSVPPSDGYYNFLLLGADSGQGRDSMRFDSISVVSVNADSGAVTIFGIPRDLRHAPFSEGPMQELYPDGFDGQTSATCGWSSGINQLMNAAEVCREDRGAGLYPDAAANNSSPAIEATKDAAEGILGISIPYHVFIDMHGFADLVDALGGVEITVKERLPEGPGPRYKGQPAEEWATGWIEAGEQRMDGSTAQWYARSRYTTSDWDRMRRQRELQTAILAQASPSTVLTRFNEVVAAGKNLVQTDIPNSLLPFLVDLAAKAKDEKVQDLELTPKGVGIDPENPTSDDWQKIRAEADALLHPPTPTPAP